MRETYTLREKFWMVVINGGIIGGTILLILAHIA